MNLFRQGVLDLDYPRDLAMAEFLVSDCNRNARMAIGGWRHWPGLRLALSGPAGSGKSHLGAIWAREAGATRVRVTTLSEGRMQHLIEAPALLVENVDALARPGLHGRRQIEAMLFHLMNLTAAEGRALMVTGRARPGRWQVETPDLASRLSALPHVAISAPDDAILSLVLQKLFRDRQQAVGEDVIAYLVLRMERSFAAARDLAAALDRKALAERRRITRPLAADLLAEGIAAGGQMPAEEAHA